MVTKNVPTVQGCTQIIKYCIQNEFYTGVLYLANLATYSIEGNDRSKQEDKSSLDDINNLLDVLMSAGHHDEQVKHKRSQHSKQNSFLVDVKSFNEWEKTYWSLIGGEPTLDGLNYLHKPKQNVKNAFTFEEICGLVYFPVNPDSPYTDIEKLLKICKQLYDASLHLQRIEIDSDNGFFKYSLSGINKIYEKIDPNSSWAKQNCGSLNQQYYNLRTQYKVDRTEYKKTKDLIQKVSSEIENNESGKCSIH